jgi:hypothetical protein
MPPGLTQVCPDRNRRTRRAAAYRAGQGRHRRQPTETRLLEVSGFIAQQVQPVLPDLIPQGPDGYLTMNYAGLTPYLVKAVQEIATITGTFKANLMQWLASADNGIQDLFAHNVYATNVTTDSVQSWEDHTQKLCVGDSQSNPNPICLTKPQLAALLSQTAAAATPESVSTSDSSGGGADLTNSGNPPHANQNQNGIGNSSSTPPSASNGQPPVIQINGDNPGHVSVGATYQDLDATITGPTDADKISASDTSSTAPSSATSRSTPAR